MGESPYREHGKDCICRGWRECVQGNSIGRGRDFMTEENGIHAHGSLHQHDQAKEPERRFLPKIGVVNARAKTG
jgi:hypothetical protein